MTAGTDDNVGATTKEFMTLYTFTGNNDALKATLLKLSDAMFSSESICREVVQRECRRVDMEFYEKRRLNHDLCNLIPGTQNLTVKKFAIGNLKTLWKDPQHIKELISRLEDLRTNYRKRQVFVCILSGAFTYQW